MLLEGAGASALLAGDLFPAGAWVAAVSDEQPTKARQTAVRAAAIVIDLMYNVSFDRLCWVARTGPLGGSSFQ